MALWAWIFLQQCHHILREGGLARIEAGNAAINAFITVDAVRRLAGELTAEWVPRARQAGIDLGFEEDGAGPTPAVQGNALLLREAIANLIDNAIRYTGRGASVTVRVRSLGPNGELYGDSGPFQPSAAVAAGLASRTRVDHNFEDPDTLRYVTPSNQGIPDATIRLFRASEWDRGRRDVAEYAVLTDANGRWKAPVWLEPGLDWVLIFEKTGEFGPDERRITV